MESAIGEHLQCPRTLTRRVPDTYTPPFPMWVGRADDTLHQVVMGYLGVQFRGEDQRPAALRAMRDIVAGFDLPDGPAHHDLTHHIDNQGYENLIVVGYWKDVSSQHRWSTSPPVSSWWESEDRLSDGLGFFREIVAPRAEQFETLYAFQDDLPGVGAVMDGVRDRKSTR